MCGNGAGIGMIISTTVKVLETTQPVVICWAVSIGASFAVVVGSTFLKAVQFFAVTATTLTAPTSAVVSVWCVLVSKLVLWGKICIIKTYILYGNIYKY